jgi:hypothetical protein
MPGDAAKRHEVFSGSPPKSHYRPSCARKWSAIQEYRRHFWRPADSGKTNQEPAKAMMNRDAPGTQTPARDTPEPVERTPWFAKWSLRGAVIRALFAVGSFAVGLILGGIPPSHSSAVRLEDPPGVELYHTAQATESERQGGNRSGGPHGNTELGRSEHRASQRLATSDTILELYETVGDDGRLTDGIKELAGLSEEGAAKAQATMDDCWRKWEQLARERTTYCPAESDHGNKVWVYRIKSFVPEGRAVLDEMKERLMADVGARSADLLIRAFHPYQYFSNLGGFDVKLTHYMESDPALPIVKAELFDPSTGKSIGYGVFSPDDTPRDYREILRFPP